MKVFLVSELFSDGDGCTEEVPESVFANKISAEVFCLDTFITRETERNSYKGTPTIYCKELQFAKNRPNEFKSRKILFLETGIDKKELSERLEYASSNYYFSIREMEVK